MRNTTGYVCSGHPLVRIFAQNSDTLQINERIELLAELGRYLSAEPDDELLHVIQKSYIEHRWFTPENIRYALKSISSAFLEPGLLKQWSDKYPIKPAIHPEITIGLVMAGNIPLVGFQDWLCVFMAGQRAKVKLSDKDKNLLPFLIKKMGNWAFESWEYTVFLEEPDKLQGFDAVIATGSNNTARYFEQYFSKYPHIIRRNRNGVAVLDGKESMADLYALGRDIFTYFGLGCRNVSKIYVPRDYDFIPLLEALHEYRDLVLHDKYKNNFDYNLTLLLLNQIPFHNNGCILLREEPSLQARIASVHYEFYDDTEHLKTMLHTRKEEIQCIVGAIKLPGVTVLPFGKTQEPSLFDYADGVDVMNFITQL